MNVDFMRKKVVIALILLLISAYSLTRAQHPTSCYYTYEHNILWMIMVADVHMGEDLSGGDQDSEYMGWVAGPLRQSCFPSLVAICGDITDGSNGWFWPIGGPYQSEWNQYRAVIDAAHMDPAVWLDIPGNHDAYGDGDLDYYLANSVRGVATGFRESSIRKNFSFGSYNFISAATPQNTDWPAPFDFTGLDDEELNFIYNSLVSNQDCALTFTFGHHPVSNYTYGKEEFLDFLSSYHVSLYGFGHVHEYDAYWRNTSLHVEVDSLGKGDNNQFGIIAIDGNGVSTRPRDVGNSPYVVITAPLDKNLGGVNQYVYPVPRDSDMNPVRALAFSVGSQIVSVRFRIDGGTWIGMNSDGSYNDIVWEGFFDARPLSYGDHVLEVQATDNGQSHSDSITFTLGFTQCTDGIDNDGDGFADLDDCGCPDVLDNDESDCTNSPTATPTPVVTNTPTPTDSPTMPPSATPTDTPIASFTPTLPPTPPETVTPTMNPTATPHSEDAQWPQFRFDPAHSGRCDAVGPESNQMQWKNVMTGDIDSSPAIDGSGNIYVGSTSHALYSFYPNGTLRWSYQTGNWVWSSPAIGEDGTVYVGSLDHFLYALNADGTLKWRFETGNWVWSSPTLAPDGSIYFGSSDKYIYALSQDGSLRWRYLTAGWVESSPAIGPDGTIYIGSSDDYLYAMTPGGALKWRYKTGRGVDSSPVVGSNNVIYVGSDDKYLYAISDSGTLLWRYLTGGSIESSPALGPDGAIYVGSNDRYLYAIDSSGGLRWRFQANAAIESSPAIDANGVIYVGSDDRSIYAINPDGSLKWSRLLGFYVKSSPAIGATGTLYVGAEDLYAIGNSSGVLKPDLLLNQHVFRGGDTFRLDLHITNPGPGITVEMYILLEVPFESFSLYYYYPSWQPEVASEILNLSIGQDSTENILLFEWPDSAGAYDGLRFWSAFFEPGTSNALGEYDIEEWSYE